MKLSNLLLCSLFLIAAAAKADETTPTAQTTAQAQTRKDETPTVVESRHHHKKAAVAAAVEDVQVHAQVFSVLQGHSLGFDRAVVSVSHAFQDGVSAQVAYDASANELFLANIAKSNVILSGDSLTLGKQYSPYVAWMEAEMGTRWISPVFAVRSGAMEDRLTGLVYAGNYAGVKYSVGAANYTDKKFQYSASANLAVCPFADVGLGYNHTDAYDQVLASAVAGLGLGKVALEAGKRINKVGAAVLGYGATLTMGTPLPKVGVYGQVQTGDADWKAAQGEKSDFSVGPSYSITKGVDAAVLFVDKVKDQDDDGFALRVAATF